MKYHNLRKVDGTTFKRSSFVPTAMSVAMAAAGIIPDVHLVRQNAITASLRNRNDNYNQRPSVHVTF